MSEANVEIVRRSFEAITDGDLEALLSLYDPAIRFLPLTGTRVETGGYRGHQGVRDYFAEVGEVWDDGKITSHCGFGTADEAREAAGLAA